MTLFATLLGGLFRLLFSIFFRFFALEKAFQIASTVSMLLLAAALFAMLQNCANGVCAAGIASIGSAHPAIGVGLGIVWNVTTSSIISCYVLIWTFCQMYVIKKRMLTLMIK